MDVKAKPVVIEATLSSESLAALRRALGVPMVWIFSLTNTVEGHIISAPNFSLHLDIQRWLVLETEWFQTPLNEIDYSQVTVSYSESPKDINLAPLQNGGHVIDYPASSIILPRPTSPIKKITIHSGEFSFKDSNETVVYDYAIIFYREDGKRFSFNADESIVNYLYCSLDENAVDSIVSKYECRVELC